MSTQDKPTGARAGWELIETRVPFQSHLSTLREDTLRVNGKNELDYAYLERADGVIIVPATRKGEIVLVRQYRYPVDDWCLELPCGGMHDANGASPEEVARKELREEIGATCEKLTYVTWFYSAPAFSNEKCHVFLAEGVELSKEPHREQSEAMNTQLVSVRDALDRACRGEMQSAPCALAVLVCEPLLRHETGRAI